MDVSNKHGWIKFKGGFNKHGQIKQTWMDQRNMEESKKHGWIEETWMD